MLIVIIFSANCRTSMACSFSTEGKSSKNSFQGIPGFEIIKQILYRYTCVIKNRCTTLNSGDMVMSCFMYLDNSHIQYTQKHPKNVLDFTNSQRGTHLGKLIVGEKHYRMVKISKDFSSLSHCILSSSLSHSVPFPFFLRPLQKNFAALCVKPSLNPQT